MRRKMMDNCSNNNKKKKKKGNMVRPCRDTWTAGKWYVDLM